MVVNCVITIDFLYFFSKYQYLLLLVENDRIYYRLITPSKYYASMDQKNRRPIILDRHA